MDVPEPRASLLEVPVSVTSVQEEPFQDSTKLVKPVESDGGLPGEPLPVANKAAVVDPY